MNYNDDLNMMNDETMYMANENEFKNNSKSKSNLGPRLAAAGAGAVLGTTAAVAGERVYDAYSNEDEAVVTNVEVESAPRANDPAHHEAPEGYHYPEAEHATVAINFGGQKDSAIPSDASFIDDHRSSHHHTHHTTTASATTQDSDDVHVVGVAVQDNGEGGMATLVGLQSGDDVALVVDVDTDGTIDYFIHDDDGNGQISEAECHNITTEQVSTAGLVNVYKAEAGAQAHVTDLETGEEYNVEDLQECISDETGNYMESETPYTATNSEEYPDYMNDADPGFMEV